MLVDAARIDQLPHCSQHAVGDEELGDRHGGSLAGDADGCLDVRRRETLPLLQQGGELVEQGLYLRRGLVLSFDL